MSAPTAAGLVAELAQRMGDYIVASGAAPIGTGSTTVLTDPMLDQWITEDVTSDLNVWVYGIATTTLGYTPADANNRGVERRGKSYTQSSHSIGLYAAMPQAIQTGNYEVHPRHARSRKLAALNSAVSLLNLAWFRDVWDTSLTTAANQWSYTLPTNILWTAVKQVEIQMLTTGSFATYPYADAMQWDYRIYPQTDASGNKTWSLQFGVMPPPNRTLRIIGRAAYAAMAAEGDILPVPDAWAEALEFVYDWAAFRLWEFEENRQPTGQTERIRQAKQDRLQQALMQLQENRPQLPNVRVAVPGMGTGQYPLGGELEDPMFLAAFSS